MRAGNMDTNTGAVSWLYLQLINTFNDEIAATARYAHERKRYAKRNKRVIVIIHVYLVDVFEKRQINIGDFDIRTL